MSLLASEASVVPQDCQAKAGHGFFFLLLFSRPWLLPSRHHNIAISCSTLEICGFLCGTQSGNYL